MARSRLRSGCMGRTAQARTRHSRVQAELGDVVYVELPEVGTEVEQGNNFGVVESVKVCGRHTRAG